MTLEKILISQAFLLSGCITVTTSEFPPHPISDSCQQNLSKRLDPVRRGPSAWAFSALQARASGHSLRAFPQRALSFLHALTVFSRPGCPICACLPSSALQGPCRVPGSDQLCLLSLFSLHPRDCWLEGGHIRFWCFLEGSWRLGSPLSARAGSRTGHGCRWRSLGMVTPTEAARVLGRSPRWGRAATEWP